MNIVDLCLDVDWDKIFGHTFENMHAPVVGAGVESYLDLWEHFDNYGAA